jgi:hypothetical protein
MKPPAPEIIDMDVAKLEAMLRRAEDASLPVEDVQTIRTLCASYLYLTDLIDKKSTTIGRLRKLLFGAQTEKTTSVLGRNGDTTERGPSGGAQAAEQSEHSDPSAAEGPTTAAKQPSSSRRPGHGRNGADDYPGAQSVVVSHESLQPGDACPACPKGTLYAYPAGTLIRFAGRAPVQATIYELQKLRCHLCGKLYTAEPPAGVGCAKYDATVVSMVGLLKYGAGVPSTVSIRCRRVWKFRCRPRPSGISSAARWGSSRRCIRS